MNHMGLLELAHIKEQEHMREALRRQAIKAARREAGVTWLQLVRARLFATRRVSTGAATPAPPPSAARGHVARQAPRLRVIRATEADCVTADC